MVVCPWLREWMLDPGRVLQLHVFPRPTSPLFRREPYSTRIAFHNEGRRGFACHPRRAKHPFVCGVHRPRIPVSCLMVAGRPLAAAYAVAFLQAKKGFGARTFDGKSVDASYYPEERFAARSFGA